MAKFSEKRREELKKERLAATIKQRVDLFKRFRDAGWDVNVMDPFSEDWVLMKDIWPVLVCHFRVKPVGAHPTRIKSVAALERLLR